MQRTASLGPNVRFYLHGLACKPDNLTLDALLLQWRGQYEILEDRHGYIQWLFPLREPGVNRLASPLTQQEVHLLRSSRVAQGKMLEGLDLMLDFYGMRWHHRSARQLGRTDAFQARYANLLTHSHNLLRISRILQSLCLFGLESFTAPIVLFFLAEIQSGALDSDAIRQSLQRFWIDCLPEQERGLMQTLAKRVLQGGLELTPTLYATILHKLVQRAICTP